ncbi:MAG: Gfo/Idh/MocA family oxidoreductase [Chloroflexi bacterium]|nr:Gfo/Idh/MocA family oxidoreductase [Chloroflexota bacterium]
MPAKRTGTERKARLGFIGAGWWATSNHIPVLRKRDDVEFVAVSRLGADDLQRVKDAFGFKYAFEDYRKLLEVEGLDGIVVASPHSLHGEHALASLRKGLHVMCEKPMTTSASEARSMVDEARRRGLHLLVPYGWHYSGFIQEAKRRLDAGAVGKIEHVLCHMASPIKELLTGGRFDTGGGFMDPESSTWADPKVAGGGYGFAQMSHSAGMMFWLTGLRAAQVSAWMSAPGSRVELYDAIAVRFSGGETGAFSGAGTLPAGRPFQLDIRVFGSEGVLTLDVERARLQVLRHDGRSFEMPLEPSAGSYSCEGPPNNFVDLILGKTKVNRAPGDCGMRAVELLDAAYRSAAKGGAAVSV